MKTTAISLISIFLSLSLQGQAKISFENTTVNYKNVQKGDDGKRSFKFTNKGDQPLKIKKVSSTSSRLEVKIPNGSVAPDKSGEIEIVYDTKKTGPIRRTITVYSNASDNPVTTLKVKGKIDED